MTQIKALNKKEHGKVKVKQDMTFSHVKENHILPLVLHEIVQASHSHPILFVKDQNTGKFKVVALAGLRPGENLYSGKLEWDGRYIPLQVRSYPFVLVKNPNNADEAVLCIDEDSDMIGESDGELLFSENGEQTEFLKDRSKSVVDVAQRVHVTDQFMEFLVAKDLLVQKKLTLRVAENEEPYDLAGFYVVDEEKFNQLSDEDFLDLRKKGVLPAVYAAMMSSMQVQSMIREKQAS